MDNTIMQTQERELSKKYPEKFGIFGFALGGHYPNLSGNYDTLLLAKQEEEEEGIRTRNLIMTKKKKESEHEI